MLRCPWAKLKQSTWRVDLFGLAEILGRYSKNLTCFNWRLLRLTNYISFSYLYCVLLKVSEYLYIYIYFA